MIFYLMSFHINVEDYKEYKEDGWGNPKLLEVVKRGFPDIFKAHNKILSILRVYSGDLGIEVFEKVSEDGDLSIVLRKNVDKDRIKVIKTLLDVMRKAYDIDNEKLRFERDEAYYRLIDMLRNSINKAR